MKMDGLRLPRIFREHLRPELRRNPLSGPCVFVLDQIKPLPAPIPMNGSQKLWRRPRLE